MKLKYSINFRIEKRKDRKTKAVIIENVPIHLDFTYDGKRLTYFTGYRIDSHKWIDVSVDPHTNEKTKIQRVKRNAINKDGVQYNIINAYLDKIKTSLEAIYIKAKATDVDIDNVFLCKELDEALGKKEKVGSDEINAFWDKWEEYIITHDVSEGRRKHLKSTRNHFRRFADFNKLDISFKSLSSELIKKFEEYLLSDKSGAKKSQNTIHGILKRVKAFFNWAMMAQNGAVLKDNPFTDYVIKGEVYGAPICMTKAERNYLFDFQTTNEKLSRVKDVFCFQTFVGCRVGDLTLLTKGDIIDDVLIYYPNKTLKDNREPAKVPLSTKAKSILTKYDLEDGSLLPYISHQKYNEYIKELFKEAKLDRLVTRLNPQTMKKETLPLHDVATSHLARRTFIHLLHKNVKDSVIGSMSGHAKGSKAFDRYYEVDDATRKEAIDKYLD